MVSRFLDLRFLWLVGAVLLCFCAVATIAVAGIVALPLCLAVFAGTAEDTAIQIFLYSAPLWAPIGFGMGVVAGGAATRGIRRQAQKGAERVSEAASD